MGWYDQLHRGASGGTTAPDGWGLFTGASQPTWRQLMKPYEIDGAAITSARGTYKLGPGAGQAPSAQREIRGVIYNDIDANTPDRYSLDGHEGSQVASHPDGRFAQNTAGTSNSALANFDLRSLVSANMDTEGIPAQEHLANPSGPSGTTSYSGLAKNRASRLEQAGASVLVAPARESSTGRTSLLTGEWGVAQLAGVSAAALMTLSLLA